MVPEVEEPSSGSYKDIGPDRMLVLEDMESRIMLPGSQSQEDGPRIFKESFS